MKRAFAFGLAATLLAATGPISAVTFTVTNTNDAGAGSLRQAILDANARLRAPTRSSSRSRAPACTRSSRAPRFRRSTRPMYPRRLLPAGVLAEHASAGPGLEHGADDRDRRDGSHRFRPLPDGQRRQRRSVLVMAVQGLVINRCKNSTIQINAGADGALIWGNFIGTDPTGTFRPGIPGLFTNVGILVDLRRLGPDRRTRRRSSAI